MVITAIQSASKIVESVCSLHRNAPEIDRRSRPIGPRKEGEFDPNSYLEALSHLRLPNGFILDFVYQQNGFGGHPKVYARRKMKKALDQVMQSLLWREAIQSPLPNGQVMADGSPEGWFELTVYRRLAGQFYLFWHALYNDFRFVTTDSHLAEIISQSNFSTDLADAARDIATDVIVDMDSDHAVVTYTGFSNWHGLTRFRETIDLNLHQQVTKTDELQCIPYDCGLRW